MGSIESDDEYYGRVLTDTGIDLRSA